MPPMPNLRKLISACFYRRLCRRLCLHLGHPSGMTWCWRSPFCHPLDLSRHRFRYRLLAYRLRLLLFLS